MLLLAVGFLAVLLAAFAVAARVGHRRGSVLLGMAAGSFAFVVLLIAYVGALSLWVRALLVEFINTQLPDLIERLLVLVDHFPVLKETL